jgi:hypothetical protein
MPWKEVALKKSLQHMSTSTIAIRAGRKLFYLPTRHKALAACSEKLNILRRWTLLASSLNTDHYRTKENMLVIILIVLILAIGGGGYYMGPGVGYYGGGGLDIVLVIILLYLLFGRSRSRL